MTEERKQELRELLARARESLVIRYKYGGPLVYSPRCLSKVLKATLEILWNRFLIVCIFDAFYA